MENYYSLSDIKSALGGEEGMGGGWFLIVILFLFLFGFGNNRNGMGMGNCGCDGYVTTSQFESENNFRTLDNSNRMTQNGLCQLGYEQANLINGSTASIIGNITEMPTTSIESKEQLNALHFQMLQIITRISEMQTVLENPEQKAKSTASDRLQLNDNGMVSIAEMTEGELTSEIRTHRTDLPTQK